LGDFIFPTKKPDIDNIAKHFDALNGVVWTDDKNVIEATILKRYAHSPATRDPGESSMSKWQPITTAPKNTEVLIFDPDSEEPQIWQAGLYEFEGDPEKPEWVTNDNVFLTGATHWMPLPDKPAR
jgi:hypothetical protein